MGSRFLTTGLRALAAAGLLAHSPVFADDTLFGDDTILDIELHGPLSATIRDRNQREERAFELRHDDESIPVKIRVRGKSRAEYCRFPPLRIRVPSNDSSSMFAGMGKLKLVPHCRNSDAYDDNVLEEFAVYRIFAMLSATSLDVRLLRIRYVDTERPKADAIVRYGFLIEPASTLALRRHGQLAQSLQVIKGRLNLEHTANVFVFQYLIANTDWSLVTAEDDEHCCHNGELLTIDGQDFIVPYDFDQSGIVNPPYARPDPDTGLRKVRMRRYRGYCVDDLPIEAAISGIVDRRTEIESLIRSLPFSNQRLAGKHVRYLSAFFTEATNTAELAAKFEDRCIG